jgi:hypothetical protein
MHIPTFRGPAQFEHIRFYVAQLPDTVPKFRPGASTLGWIAGRGENGVVVACLAPMTAKDGLSPLSECR